jgi:hypothetical protein
MDFTYEESAEQQPVEREIVPIGIHEMEIRHAEEGPNEWKQHETNPEGMCLKLRLSTGQYRFIFDDIPQHLGWRAKQLADALGQGVDGQRISLEPDSLVGQTIRVEVSHYTSKAGKVSAVVKKYLPAVADKPAAKKAEKKPRVTTAVALASDDGDDDIPF